MPVTDTDNQLKEKCAVFGVIGTPASDSDKQTGLEAARLTFYGLWALQHRGQESSGIASSDGQEIHRHTAPGLVANVYHEEDLEQLPGHIAIGHNRYSTSGGSDDFHNQPIVDYELGFAFAHNGNIPDCAALETFLESRDVNLKNLNDSGMMAAAIGCYMRDGLTLEGAVKKAYPLFTGVFSCVAMDKTTLVAFRDRCGIRPLSLGKLENGHSFASETCAFDTIGATFIRDVKPGEMVTINVAGDINSQQLVRGDQKLDIFEFVYFARPDSQLMGKRVDAVRKNFGREMAKEFPVKADVIVPVPDSGIPAALGYSQATGIPFEMGLMKNRYIHRTFIRPTAALRERDLKMKLNPVIETLRKKRVVLVDDSIVRGTTMRKVVAMLFEAGAKEVHLLITCPPVRYPDFYGINTPNQDELIAAQMSVKEICDYVGATSLHFLSYNGMIKATGIAASKFSTSCFNGIYPIPVGQRARNIALLNTVQTRLTTAGQLVLLPTTIKS
jgi:amidophosphoribosyltransferase